MEIDPNKIKFTKEKILRFKPIAFIKKYLIIFITILIFVITLWIGVWNIKGYEIINKDGGDNQVIENRIGMYIDENILGRNYFSFKNTDVEKELKDSFTYIKEISVEKVMPNKLTIFVELYQPSIVGELKDNNCYLLSSDGYYLEDLCVEGEEDCCMNYASKNDHIYLKALDSNISSDSLGKNKLLIMENLTSVLSVINSYGYGINKITLEEEILKLYTTGNEIFVFNFNEDLELQLQRFIIVAGKIKEEDTEFSSLDLRFERPVLKN